MKIALVTDGIWPYVIGGMQKHSYYLCKYFAKNEINVHLFHFNQSDYDISKLEFFTDEERKYITVTLLNFPKSIWFPGHYLFNSYRYSKNVFKILKEKLSLYDFIYSKGFSAWYLVNQKNNSKVIYPPISVNFHGYEMFQKAANLKSTITNFFLFRSPVKSISKKADFVCSYGGKITDIIKSFNIDDSKIIELTGGVELSFVSEKINIVSEKINFLFIGRSERRKGIEELNKAIQIYFLAHSNSNCTFNFIGPFLAKNKLIHKSVFYHGEIRDKNILKDLIQQNDILICPSWSEGMPNVILEAMANGLAIIATNVGASNAIVDSDTGWLLKSSNPIHIKKVLELVTSLNYTQINIKKQNALNRIKENYVWEKLIIKLITKIQN